MEKSPYFHNTPTTKLYFIKFLKEADDKCYQCIYFSVPIKRLFSTPTSPIFQIFQIQARCYPGRGARLMFRL